LPGWGASSSCGGGWPETSERAHTPPPCPRPPRPPSLPPAHANVLARSPRPLLACSPPCAPSRRLQAREGPPRAAVAVAAAAKPEEPGLVRGVPRSPLRCALCIRRARLAGRAAGGARAAAAWGWRRGGRLSGWRGPWHGGVNTSCFSPPLLPGSFYYYYFFSLSSVAPSVQSARQRCRPAGEQGGGTLVLSCLFFFFFLKQNSKVPGKGEAESKGKGEAEPMSSRSYSSKMKKDFKASDPARRV
jgi:hypothetical protein